ncbi:MAG: aminotransferase class I/II-fold pyridoxal phosphate-dependent enzyme, partial [Xanthomonadaceae bacterium]|nr:aminotransferase class I/II-fold pyridoxal phosphate-dependent enzyme [Xanthomonadaceae bacterium]
DLTLATLSEGDTILAPNPAYPIHPYGPIIAGAKVIHVETGPDTNFEENLLEAIESASPKPKMMFLNFPSNPTTECVDLDFFERIVKIAKEHGIWIVHDLAYADLAFDGYKAPSIMQVEGAKEIAVESFTLSKSYNMPGWRVGFMVGNPILIAALAKMKSYLDYGTFAPIQMAAIEALTGPQECVQEISDLYEHRRNVLCDGLNAIGWPVEKPKASMFVWAKIPEAYRDMGSMEFAKKLINEASVAVSPGIGFGEKGDHFVRLGLIVDDERTAIALESIRAMFEKDGVVA